MSMPFKEAFNIEKISDRKSSYGIEGITVDGNNVVDVFNAVKYFSDYTRNGNGPVLVECVTYRYKGHSKSDAQAYRTKEEVKEWMDKDPIKVYKDYLFENKVIDGEMFAKIEQEVEDEMTAAVNFAEESPFPDRSEVEDDIYYE